MSAGVSTGVSTGVAPESAEPDGVARARGADWRAVVARYEGADAWKSLTQLVTTLALLVATLVVMHRLLALAPWATALLWVLAAGLMVRTFIIMHDCAHGSFLPWPRVNDAVGIVTGIVMMTPYVMWRRVHAMHHATAGDLDRRGHGDIETLTVREYRAASRWGRLRYRIFRHPAFLLTLGPLHLILVQRFPSPSVAGRRRERISVWTTNVAIAGLLATFVLVAGARSVLLVYLPSFYLACVVGVWLVVVQHHFEDTYWQPHETWDYQAASVRGSSHLRLPRLLQWFTGSIGLHHVHHLAPRIPNYRLQRAHDENAFFREAPVLTLVSGVRAMRLALWDEEKGKLVKFSDVGEG